MSGSERDSLVEQIRRVIEKNGLTWISRKQFLTEAGLKVADIFRHFPSWSEAVAATGLDLEPYNQKIPTEDLFADWADVVRRRGGIPTRNQYRLEGGYSPGAFESRFGPWSMIPARFRGFAEGQPEWADVLALLPRETVENAGGTSASPSPLADPAAAPARAPGRRHHLARPDRPTYGDPIDFRGLRHAPVNENGVVFLFGMVAKELGYMVEAIQIGFPDCEAKRQVGPGKWQRARIEFEFESRHFVEHGHSPLDCDVLVCWRHNWAAAPTELEIVELRMVIETLAKSEE